MSKPVHEIIDDIRQRRAKRAIFIDLNIIADRAYATELFEALVPLNIQWYGLATTLLCDDVPLLDLAARSGCRGLLMGLESIRSENLRLNQKQFNQPENYANVVQMLHDRGIALQGCFVFGMDHDTTDVFQQTSEMAVEIGIDLPRFAILTPFPGTPQYRSLDSQSRILSQDWGLYDGQHVVFQPARMTVDDLARGNESAWQYAYRWRSVAKRLLQTAAPLHVAATTNLGYRYYARNLHRFYQCDWMSATIPQRNRRRAKHHTSGRVAIGANGD